ncbi:hypothetical protein M885DRAFT_24331 [Pelagophyceae sp. CCMP2097]|nr:hypothetical protein M885DRAFT_24331 [Pelagophyceae sp. CCMP2097]
MGPPRLFALGRAHVARRGIHGDGAAPRQRRGRADHASRLQIPRLWKGPGRRRAHHAKASLQGFMHVLGRRHVQENRHVRLRLREVPRRRAVALHRRRRGAAPRRRYHGETRCLLGDDGFALLSTAALGAAAGAVVGFGADGVEARRGVGDPLSNRPVPGPRGHPGPRRVHALELRRPLPLRGARRTPARRQHLRGHAGPLLPRQSLALRGRGRGRLRGEEAAAKAPRALGSIDARAKGAVRLGHGRDGGGERARGHAGVCPEHYALQETRRTQAPNCQPPSS